MALGCVVLGAVPCPPNEASINCTRAAQAVRLLDPGALHFRPNPPFLGARDPSMPASRSFSTVLDVAPQRAKDGVHQPCEERLEAGAHRRQHCLSTAMNVSRAILHTPRGVPTHVRTGCG